jgi:hypothetical protein
MLACLPMDQEHLAELATHKIIALGNSKPKTTGNLDERATHDETTAIKNPNQQLIDSVLKAGMMTAWLSIGPNCGALHRSSPVTASVGQPHKP